MDISLHLLLWHLEFPSKSVSEICTCKNSVLREHNETLECETLDLILWHRPDILQNSDFF